jgi:hypothetical protein
MRHPDINNCPLCGKPISKYNIYGHITKEHPDITLNEYKQKYLGWIIPCDVCGELFPSEEKMIRHKQFNHGFKSLKHIERETHKNNMKMEYSCQICNFGVPNKSSLAKHIKKCHPEMSLLDYYIKYMNPENPSMKCLECGQPLRFRGLGKGIANFCSFSCSTSWYAKNTNRIETAMSTLKERKKKDPNLQLMPNHLKYWTNKGLTEEQARLKVRERQQTFTLEKCIQKYGEIDGRLRWKQRQDKWITNYKKRNFSKISQELFWNIFDKLPIELKSSTYFAQNNNGQKDESGKNHEYKIETVDSYAKLDFYIKGIDLCIEFDGDYWHGKHLSRADVNKTRNQNREQNIVNFNPNIEFIHVKEHEYKSDKDIITNNLIKKILEKYESRIPTI